MLRRRISDTLAKWKAKPNHLPLVVYINFYKEEERKMAFYGSKDVDNVFKVYTADAINAMAREIIRE